MTATHCHYRSVLITQLFLILISFLFGCSSTDNNSSIGYRPSGAEDQFNLKVSIEAAPCPITAITFDLPVTAFVDLDILSATGYVVRNLYNEEAPPGTYDIEWDLTNDNGDAIETGIYLIRLRAGTYEHTLVTSLCFSVEDCEEMYGE